MPDCIEWTGARCHGYGYRSYQGKVRRVHRLVWEQAHGPIPEGMVVMHLCNNRACINLDHLRMGTQSENIQQAWNEGRIRIPQTKLTPDEVREIRASDESTTVLMERYGLSRVPLNNIRAGRSWKNVE